MNPAAYAAFLIASVIGQLASPPAAFRWRAEDAVAEAVSVSPDGVGVGVWCEALHGSEARCFAQENHEAPVPIFRGGAIDDADTGLRPPFAGVRHFSMTGGRIDWDGGKPIFSIACHTGAISGVCQQSLGGEPLVIGRALQPLDSRVLRVGSTTIWNDMELSRTVFRAGERTIDVCCAGDVAAYAAAPLAGGELLLIYAGGGRQTDLRTAVVARDLSVRRDAVLARDIATPTNMAAVSANGTVFVIWSGGGVFAGIGGKIVKLSDSGVAPAIATDGQRVLAAWLERGAVMTAELSRPDLPRSLLALAAATVQPFLTLDCSQGKFIAFWRAASTGRDDIVIATRDLP